MTKSHISTAVECWHNVVCLCTVASRLDACKVWQSC